MCAVGTSPGLATLDEKDRAALLAFQKKAGELQRAIMGTSAAAEDTLRNTAFMKKAFKDTPGADPKLAEAAAPSLMERVSAQLDATAPITQSSKEG